MEPRYQIILLVLLLAVEFCDVTDGVLCFNCVSTETPGCGEDLDLDLIGRSSTGAGPNILRDNSRRVSSQAELKTLRNPSREHSTGRKNPRSRPDLTNQLSTGSKYPHNRVGITREDATTVGQAVASTVYAGNDSTSSTIDLSSKLTLPSQASRGVMATDATDATDETGETDETDATDATAENGMHSRRRVEPSDVPGLSDTDYIDIERNRRIINHINLNITTEPPFQGFGMDSEIGKLKTRGEKRAETETRGDNLLAAASLVQSPREEEEEEVGENLPRSGLVVKCPGNTCLLQRLPSSDGDIFVRTCDVSHVTGGQCHLVTDVLGARVSVVCVCTGDLCNQNAASGVTSSKMLYWNSHVLVAMLVLLLALG